MFKTLTRQEVRDAVSGKSDPPHVPVQYTAWLNPFEFKGLDFARCIISRLLYRDDIAVVGWHDLRWHLYHMDERNGNLLRCVALGLGKAPPPLKKYLSDGDKGMDNHVLLEDMTKVDEFISKLPNPNHQILLYPGPTNRYKVAWMFSCLFENHWNVRGMENALMDYYIYPEETHKLYKAFTDYHLAMVKRVAKMGCDAYFFSDDIGTQTGPFFSPDIFKEFFFPCYKQIIDYAHSLGLQVWFHSCGNVESFVPLLIEAGLDVIHPIQKFANDQEGVFKQYHDQICFMYGFDLQQVIPLGTADDVEAEVHRTMDIFSQATGRLIYTSGNAFTGDCPITSFERLMKVSHTYNPYATKKRKAMEEAIRISAEAAAEKVLAKNN